VTASQEAAGFASIPPALRRLETPSPWAREVLDADRVGSFLEGPCFGPDGTLYVSDLAHGRVFAVTQDGTLDVLLDYGGEPNGLAFHPDGMLYIADYRLGILAYDMAEARMCPIVSRYRLEPFRGVSDMVFDHAGTLYFSDQGQSDICRRTGRLFRWTERYGTQLLLDELASPNGVGLSPDGSALYLALTRGACVYRVPLRRDGTVGKVSVYLHSSGGTGGPDGLAVAADGGLAVAHYGLGCVRMHDSRGQLIGTVTTPTGLGTTNVAYGLHDPTVLYITEADSGSILRADTGAPGLPLPPRL
jgi:gluconolactonase